MSSNHGSTFQTRLQDLKPYHDPNRYSKFPPRATKTPTCRPTQPLYAISYIGIPHKPPSTKERRKKRTTKEEKKKRGITKSKRKITQEPASAFAHLMATYHPHTPPHPTASPDYVADGDGDGDDAYAHAHDAATPDQTRPARPARHPPPPRSSPSRGSP